MPSPVVVLLIQIVIILHLCSLLFLNDVHFQTFFIDFSREITEKGLKSTKIHCFLSAKIYNCKRDSKQWQSFEIIFVYCLKTYNVKGDKTNSIILNEH